MQRHLCDPVLIQRRRICTIKIPSRITLRIKLFGGETITEVLKTVVPLVVVNILEVLAAKAL